ncbi:MAG: choice-of-anchor J domain-containing protein [Bacteroidaceae bacterium]|nr:choice-of-anchor J domain-containing protein [Bacteroidaceae bacterium]
MKIFTPLKKVMMIAALLIAGNLSAATIFNETFGTDDGAAHKYYEFDTSYTGFSNYGAATIVRIGSSDIRATATIGHCLWLPKGKDAGISFNDFSAVGASNMIMSFEVAVYNKDVTLTDEIKISVNGQNIAYAATGLTGGNAYDKVVCTTPVPTADVLNITIQSSAAENTVGYRIDNVLIEGTKDTSVPEITATAAIFEDTTVGKTTSAQTIEVGGNNLSSAITYAVSGDDAAAFNVTGTLTANGGNLSATFAPTKVGAHAATLTLTSGTVEKTLTLSGNGLSPNILVTNEFTTTLEPFTAVSVQGENAWGASIYGAKMSGHNDGANEDWLISPALDLSSVTAANVTFTHASNFAVDMPTEYTMWFSTTYNGNGTINAADWKQVTITTYPAAQGWDSWVDATIDFPADVMQKSNVYFAFKYMCTDASAGTWEVKNLVATATSTVGISANEENATKVYANGKTIVVENTVSQPVAVYTITGQVVAQQAATVGTVKINTTNSGLFIVAVGNKAYKVIVK